MSVKPVGRSTQIWLPEAVIPRETLHGSVTADLHDGERVNPRPAHVRDRRMAEVMKAETFDPGQPASSRKCLSEVLHRPAFPKEDVLLMDRPGLP